MRYDNTLYANTTLIKGMVYLVFLYLRPPDRCHSFPPRSKLEHVEFRRFIFSLIVDNDAVNQIAIVLLFFVPTCFRPANQRLDGSILVFGNYQF